MHIQYSSYSWFNTNWTSWPSWRRIYCRICFIRFHNMKKMSIMSCHVTISGEIWTTNQKAGCRDVQQNSRSPLMLSVNLTSTCTECSKCGTVPLNESTITEWRRAPSFRSEDRGKNKIKCVNIGQLVCKSSFGTDDLWPLKPRQQHMAAVWHTERTHVFMDTVSYYAISIAAVLWQTWKLRFFQTGNTADVM